MNQFEIIKATELFRNVSDGDVNKIVALCTEKTYAKDSVIMEEGSAGHEMYILTKGLVGIDVRIGYYAMSNLSAILAERLVMANINMLDMMSKHHQIGV